MSEFFLLNLRVSGIKNIETPIEIPFYKKTIKNDFDPERYRIKGIYGENGSGKTAIMTAVKILTRLLLDKNYLTDSVNQRLLAENINKRTREGFIEVTFYSASGTDPLICHYKVGLAAGADGRVYITEESLEQKNGRYSQNAYTPVFATRNGSLAFFAEEELFEQLREKTQNLLEQRAFATFSGEISPREADQNHPGYHLNILQYFAAGIHVVIDGEDDHRLYAWQNLSKGRQTLSLRETEALTVYSWASTAGENQKEVMIPRSRLNCYKKQVERLYSFIRIFKTDLKDIVVRTKEYGEFYLCRRVMVYEGYELDEEFESRGIRKLMGLFEALDAACREQIVFIDELDSNINDIYLDKLIEFFVYYGKGQLCFTAHNLSPMSVLRGNKLAISFISNVNTVHTWTSNGNQTPEHAYRDGFIEDSPFNVDATDFLGILGGVDE